jgi:glycosyltransferase involved in cell wall biosynthesis
MKAAPPRLSSVPSTPSPAPFRKDLLLCFSHLRWDFVWQRPQHLLSRAARHFRVVFFEEPMPSADGQARLVLEQRPGGITLAVPHLPAGLTEAETVRLQRRLVDELLAREARSPAVLWYYSPMAYAFSDHLSGEVCVYDCMDELSAFRGASPHLRAMERRLITRADLMFTGGVSLWEAKRDLHPNVYAFPSSIDARHFARALDPDRIEPEDQARIPGPRIGFFGVVDERMDVGLVGATAALRPDWHFVMIGPVVKIDAASLPRAANIHWLGGKSYAELPDYLGGWDAGFMPFAMNEATRFISPTKTPEFLAAGLPVVSTPVRDVVRPYGEKGLVRIAANAEEMVGALTAVIAGAAPSWRGDVQRHLSTTSWDRTWGAMHRLVAGRQSHRTRAVPRTLVADVAEAARV